MIKKFISAALCLIMILPLFAYAEQSGGSNVIYRADFDNNELPPGSDVTFGDDGFIFAEKGRLVLEASDTYPPVSTVLFPYEVKSDEYMYECEVTLDSALSGECWFSLCFGAVNDNILYQFTLKHGCCSEDGVSLQYKNGASSWKTLCFASLNEYIGEGGIDPDKFSGAAIKPGAEFTVAVAVKEGMAIGCIDGIAVIEGGIPANRCGRIGLNGRGVNVSADNLTVSSFVPSWVSAADSFSASLYTPDTGIVGAPAVIQRDRLSLPIYTVEKQRPSAVLMTVREAGGALHGYDGAVDLGELETRIMGISDLALPAFYVSDASDAAKLSSFIDEHGLNDCFVIVSKASLLSEFKSNRYLRTVLDMSSRSGVSGAEISSLLYSNGCRTVMLSETAADKDTVYELHRRLITVWVSGTAGVDSLFDSAVNGADAIVTSEAPALLSVFEKVGDTALMRRKTVIADGGDESAAPSNTLKGVLSALEYGVSAVRLGVRRTGDGEAVLFDSDLTVGMSDTLSIADSTLSELKALSYTDRRMGAADGITTLEELFEAVYKAYPDSVFHLDISGAETFSPALALIKEYEMSDRTVILSTDPTVLSSAASEGMAAAYTGGPYTWDGRGAQLCVSSLCRTLNGMNSAYYAEADQMPEELINLMNSRGMYVCLTGADGDKIPLTSGCGAFTVSSPSRISKLAVSLEASADKDGRLSARVKYCDGAELDVTALCDIVTVSGEVRLSGGTVRGDGVFAVICPQTSDDGEKYGICSQLLKISEHPDETEPEDDTDVSDDRTLTIIIIAASSAAAAAGVIVLLYLARKKRKNDKKQQQ